MILYLQQFIYQQLNDTDIINSVTGIYYQVPANTKFPYIYFGNFISKDISAKDQNLQEISFKLIIYQRDKSIKSMLLVASKIVRKLTCDAYKEIVTMRCLEQKIHLQNDGITQEIIMTFKALGAKNGI